MDILSSNKTMTCPKSDIKLVGHVIDTGVNPVGILAGRVETVRYADVAGDTSRTLGGGSVHDYADRYGSSGHGTGVAYLMCHDVPNMKIRSYNSFLGVDGCVNKCLAAVLQYVESHPEERHVVNMSLHVGGTAADESIEMMHGYIKQLAALNVAVVVAAGNDGQEKLDAFPSCFEEPITVAAVYNDGRKAEFSVWHNEVDFAEIGVAIPRLTNTGEMKNGSGTSFAAPIVCNKLSKIWLSDPTLTEAQLYARAVASCQDFGTAGRDPYFGWGWIAKIDAPATPALPSNPEKENDAAPVVEAGRVLYLTTPRMSGADVYALEKNLEALGYDCKMSSGERSSGIGVFGPACAAALRDFQKAKSVDVFGKLCPDTRAALSAAIAKLKTPTPGRAAAELHAWLRSRVGSPYLWGGQGEDLVALVDAKGKPLGVSSAVEWIRKRETSTTNVNRVLAFIRPLLAAEKKPILAYDCGGLIVAWLMEKGLLKDDVNANGLWGYCQKITMGGILSASGIVCVVRLDASDRAHHIGVYVGDNQVIHAKGRDDGVVCESLDANGSGWWNGAGILTLIK